jgi:hypothetical protein
VVGVDGVAWTDLLYRVYWGSEGARRACLRSALEAGTIYSRSTHGRRVTT